MSRRKALGQHFLRDERYVGRIMAAAKVCRGESILEIGPGPGALTGPLVSAVGPEGRVVAVEADPVLAAGIAEQWPAVELVEGDAVRVDLASHGPFDAVVSNLPYSISGPITIRLLDMLDVLRWKRAVLMYQAEFARRLLAAPGSSTYGRLTVHAARRVSVERVCDVPPGAFAPPPKVDSMVVCLRPHAAPPFEVRNEALWRAVVDGAFGQRRKQLRNTVPAAVAGLGVSRDVVLDSLASRGWSSLRPESLAPAQFAELASVLEA